MRLMTRDRLLDYLMRAEQQVTLGDSHGGFVEWITLAPAYADEHWPLLPRTDVYLVRVTLRGAADMVVIGQGDEPESEDEAVARGCPEPPPPGGWDPPANLLPCPFCGGEARLRRTLREGCLPAEVEAFAHYATCRSCAATGGWDKSASGAAKRWNWRPTPSGAIDQEEPVNR